MPFAIVASLFAIALVGITVGIWLAEIPDFSRRVVPFSGGLLLGIGLFWLLPEIAGNSGWPIGLGGILVGFGLLWGINRFLYPVCPSCAHSHDHEACAEPLHGFASPLLAAAAVHAFFDGWSLAISQHDSSSGLRLAVLVGIGIHKFPEGLALGSLLLAALGSIWKTMAGGLAVQSCMFAGAALAMLLTGHVAASGTATLLAISAGVFAYLGYHAIEGSWRGPGLARSIMPALTGAAGAAALRLVPGL